MAHDENLLGGVTPVRAGALTAIPYYAWSNRGKNAMRVFIREQSAE